MGANAEICLREVNINVRSKTTRAAFPSRTIRKRKPYRLAFPREGGRAHAVRHVDLSILRERWSDFAIARWTKCAIYPVVTLVRNRAGNCEIPTMKIAHSPRRGVISMNPLRKRDIQRCPMKYGWTIIFIMWDQFLIASSRMAIYVTRKDFNFNRRKSRCRSSYLAFNYRSPL